MSRIEQGLHQKLLQKMSPQQIQLMKLLQIPAGSLEQRIKEELEANPALEDDPEPDQQTEAKNETDEPTDQQEGEERDDSADKEQTETETEAEAEEEKSDNDELEKLDSLDDYLGGSAEQADYMDFDEVAEYRMKQEVDRDEQEKKQIPLAMSHSFHDHLLSQLSSLDLTERQRELCEYVIGSIDEDGYLRRPLEAMVDDLAFSFNIQTDEQELREIVEEIQLLDPPGVGACDLRECLLLQLYRKTEHPKLTDIAIRIIDEYFDAFTKKHYDKLQKQLSLDDETLKKAIGEILHLNPKPGSAFNQTDNAQSFLVPDFYISNNDGKLDIMLNSRNIPELRVSNSFREMMHNYQKGARTDKKQKEALVFIKQKIDSAKWFIDALKQR